eukprot:6169533-Pleurochrysis_carterae.AAC.1
MEAVGVDQPASGGRTSGTESRYPYAKGRWWRRERLKRREQPLCEPERSLAHRCPRTGEHP